MNPSRPRMIGRCQKNGIEYLRWCFVIEYQKYIQGVKDVHQDPLLNSKEVDVAHCKAWGSIPKWKMINWF